MFRPPPDVASCAGTMRKQVKSPFASCLSGGEHVDERESGIELEHRSRCGIAKVLHVQAPHQFCAKRYSICTEQERRDVKKKFIDFVFLSIKKKSGFLNCLVHEHSRASIDKQNTASFS